MSQVSWATGTEPKTARPSVHPDALYSSTKGVTVYPVQMHNTSQMSFNPNTGLVYVPIAVENTFSFVASESYTATPGNQNFGLNLGAARGGTPMASKCAEAFSARGIPPLKRNAGSHWAADSRAAARCPWRRTW